MAQTDDDLKVPDDRTKQEFKQELLAQAEKAEALARRYNHEAQQQADDDGMAQPVFKDKEQAFDAGVNAGYQQCLNDIADMLDRQKSMHQQRMRGVRVNL